MLHKHCPAATTHYLHTANYMGRTEQAYHVNQERDEGVTYLR